MARPGLIRFSFTSIILVQFMTALLGCGTGSDRIYKEFQSPDSVGNKDSGNPAKPAIPPSLLDAISDDQLKINALKVSQELKQCKDPDKDAVVASVQSGMDQCCTQSPKNPADHLKTDPTVVAAKESLSIWLTGNFESELRLQILKNAIITHREFQLRYNRNSPGPRQLWTVGAMINEFCKDRDGKDTCSESDRGVLRKTVEDYDAYYRKNAWTYTPEAAAQELGPLMGPFYEKIQERQEVGKKLMEALPKYKPKSGMDETWTMGSEQRLKTSITAENMMSPASASEYVAYADNPNSPLGKSALARLFHTKAMWTGGQKPEDIKNAVNEILTATAHLAWDTNQASHSSKSEHDLDQAELFYQNPIAVAQVLIQHPKYASEACKLIQVMQDDRRWKKRKRKMLRVASYGGMIIGGVLTLSGVGAEAGVPLLAVSAETMSAAAAAGEVLYATSTVGALIDNRYQAADYAYQANANTQALAAGTGGDVDALLAAESGLKEADREFTFLVLQALTPAVLNGVSKLSLASKLANSRAGAAILKFRQTFSNAPKVQLGLESLDYLCGSLPDDYSITCDTLLQALGEMTPEKQKETLSDQKKMADFVNTHAPAPEVIARKESSSTPSLEEKFVQHMRSSENANGEPQNFVDHYISGETSKPTRDGPRKLEGGLHEYWNLENFAREYNDSRPKVEIRTKTYQNKLIEYYLPRDAVSRKTWNKMPKVTMDGVIYARKTGTPIGFETLDLFKVKEVLKRYRKIQTSSGTYYQEGYVKGIYWRQYLNPNGSPKSIYPIAPEN